MSIESGSFRRHIRISVGNPLVDVNSYLRRFEESKFVRDVSVIVSEVSEDTPNESTKCLIRGLHNLKILRTLSFEPSGDDNGNSAGH